MSRKRPPPPPPSQINEWQEFYDLLVKESDRGAALIGAALLHDQLKTIARAKFVSDHRRIDALLEGDAPLSTFAALTNLVYCLGLIGSEPAHDLDCVRKVRNQFAHVRHPLDFDQSEIAGLCNSLQAPTLLDQAILDAGALPWPGKPLTPRPRFLLTVSLLAITLEYVKVEAAPFGKASGYNFRELEVIEEPASAIPPADVINIRLRGDKEHK